MDIKYFNDGDTTIAVANYSENLYNFVPGVPNGLYWDMAFNDESKLSSRDRKVLRNFAKFTSHASLAEGDVYDETIGKNITRDKLIIKDAERTQAKYEVVVKYLTRILDDIKYRMEKNEERMGRAYDRLGEYEGTIKEQVVMLIANFEGLNVCSAG